MKYLFFVTFIFVSALSLAAGAATELKNEDFENICKGAISVEFSKPIKTIKLRNNAPKYSESDPMVRVYYMRADDGTKWEYDCKFSGNRVYWRSANNNNGSPGRWRDMPRDKFGDIADAIVSFEVQQNKIIVESSLSDDKAVIPRKP